MNRRSVLTVALLIVALGGCNGFVGEVEVEKPRGPIIPIVDPDYVVLRPVSSNAPSGASSASVSGQTLYFKESERIIDLRHLDPRTARVEERAENACVVWIETTHEGDRLLGEWTGDNIEKQLGLFIAGRLISAPIIKSKITGGVLIDHEFSRNEAEMIAARLRRGGASV